MNHTSIEQPSHSAVQESVGERGRISNGDDVTSHGRPTASPDDSPGAGPSLRFSSIVLEAARGILRCPACGSGFNPKSDVLICTNRRCGMDFPVVNGVPVLINDSGSLFARADFVSAQADSFDPARGKWLRWLDRLLPDLSRNLAAPRNYRMFGELLQEQSEKPVILVVGGRVLGRGMERLAADPKMRLIETDVGFGPRTQLICDAHDLPFESNSFDGVVAQAVLQYVTDPDRCVREIERVLKPGGLVYAETAFMQQVVHGRHDFTRFTHLGQRRLFRAFKEVASGPACGPGMALAWSCQFFLLSLASSRWARRAAYALARLTLFWLKYFDAALMDKSGTYDAASGFYFLGRKGGPILSDHELIALYRGAQ